MRALPLKTLPIDTGLYWYLDIRPPANNESVLASALVPQDSEQATNFLISRLTEEDVVLVKGSRGMQMDLIVSTLEKVS